MLVLGELLFLGRAVERARRGLAAGYHHRDLVEVAHTDLALVAGSGIAVGLGGELATSRALFDISRVMALIVVVVVFALVTEYVLLHPLRDRLERWREAGLPWGVKR